MTEEKELYDRMAEAAHQDWVADEELRDLEEKNAALSAQLAEAVELVTTIRDASFNERSRRIKELCRAFLEKREASRQRARPIQVDSDIVAVLRFYSQTGDEMLPETLLAAHKRAAEMKLIFFVDCCDEHWALTASGKAALEKHGGSDDT